MGASVAAMCAAAVLLLGACGQPIAGGPAPFNPPVAVPVETASDSPSARPTADPAAKRGQCFDYATTDHLVIDTTEPFVSCARPHSARTVHVGELTDATVMSFADAQTLLGVASRPGGLESLPADLRVAYSSLMTAMEATREECTRIIDETVGAVLPSGVRQSTVLTADLTGPVPEQWDAGDRWVRCNVVARVPGEGAAAAERLLPLRPDLVNSLDDTTYRVCWVGGPDEQRIACGDDAGGRQVWVTVSDRVPTPQTPWPGDEAAQDAADLACRAVVLEAGAAADPSLLALGRVLSADQTTVTGFTAETWGTDAAAITCAVPIGQFAG